MNRGLVLNKVEIYQHNIIVTIKPSETYVPIIDTEDYLVKFTTKFNKFLKSHRLEETDE